MTYYSLFFLFVQKSKQCIIQPLILRVSSQNIVNLIVIQRGVFAKKFNEL